MFWSRRFSGCLAMADRDATAVPRESFELTAAAAKSSPLATEETNGNTTWALRNARRVGTAAILVVFTVAAVVMVADQGSIKAKPVGGDPPTWGPSLEPVGGLVQCYSLQQHTQIAVSLVH